MPIQIFNTTFLDVVRPCLHIIHLPHRTDRWELLQQELQRQQVDDFRIWEGIRDPECPPRGISKAHKQIIAWAAAHGCPQVLIAEDDVLFSAAGALDYFLANVPPDFDLYLGGIIWGNVKSDDVVDDFAGPTLYLVNERFYATLLNLREDIDYDRAMAGLGRFVVCNPMVVCQQDGYSDHYDRPVRFSPLTDPGKWFIGEIDPYRAK